MANDPEEPNFQFYVILITVTGSLEHNGCRSLKMFKRLFRTEGEEQFNGSGGDPSLEPTWRELRRKWKASLWGQSV